MVKKEEQLKDDKWEYKFPKELHDRFARVYCEDSFGNRVVDVDLVHRFLEVAQEYYTRSFEELDEENVFKEIMKVPIMPDMNVMKWHKYHIEVTKAIVSKFSTKSTK